MPDYAKVARDRDLFGELGWIPNFDKKVSKDNHKLYQGCREFFDTPLSYPKEVDQEFSQFTPLFRRTVISEDGGSPKLSLPIRTLNTIDHMSYSTIRGGA